VCCAQKSLTSGPPETGVKSGDRRHHITQTELRICTCNFLARVGTTIVEEEADASTSSH